MSQGSGRPKSDMPKDVMFRVRLDVSYELKLAQCAQELQISKSEVVRRGIDLVMDEYNIRYEGDK